MPTLHSEQCLEQSYPALAMTYGISYHLWKSLAGRSCSFLVKFNSTTEAALMITRYLVFYVRDLGLLWVVCHIRDVLNRCVLLMMYVCTVSMTAFDSQSIYMKLLRIISIFAKRDPGKLYSLMISSSTN